MFLERLRTQIQVHLPRKENNLEVCVSPLQLRMTGSYVPFFFLRIHENCQIAAQNGDFNPKKAANTNIGAAAAEFAAPT